jgi:CRISPR type I-E-associated protein CasB/Cse2
MDELFSSADRAALKRGTDPWEVRGFYDLQRRYPAIHPLALAQASPVLALIRERSDRNLGALCHGALSERRFRRLLQARDREDLAHQLAAVVRILRGRCDPDEIVTTIAYWGDKTRRRLAQDYYGTEEEE